MATAVCTLLLSAGCAPSELSEPRTHVFTIELPFPVESTPDAPARAVDQVTVDREGRIAWNGRPVTLDGLDANARGRPSSLGKRYLEFAPDGAAPYGDVFAALGVLWGAQMTADGFCFAGLERHRALGETRPQAAEPEQDAPCSYNMGWDTG